MVQAMVFDMVVLLADGKTAEVIIPNPCQIKLLFTFVTPQHNYTTQSTLHRIAAAFSEHLGHWPAEVSNKRSEQQQPVTAASLHQ